MVLGNSLDAKIEAIHFCDIVMERLSGYSPWKAHVDPQRSASRATWAHLSAGTQVRSHVRAEGVQDSSLTKQICLWKRVPSSMFVAPLIEGCKLNGFWENENICQLHWKPKWSAHFARARPHGQSAKGCAAPCHPRL